MLEYICCLLAFTLTVILYKFVHYRKFISHENKCVLITGCDSGFGFELSKALDNKGFTIFSGCLFPEGGGANELRQLASNKLHIVPLDVTVDSQVQDALQYVTQNLGYKDLWAVVNNAGIAGYGETEWCPMELYNKMMQVNTFGVIRVTKAFLPLIRKAKGRIVNIASLAGRNTLPGFTAYSASKAACIAFSDGLRREMRNFGVEVILLEASLYRTPIADKDMHLKEVDCLWKETSEGIKQDYGEKYYQEVIKAMVRFLKKSSKKTYQVIDMLEDAVMSERPQIRYVPNSMVRIGTNVLISLPIWLQDMVLHYEFRNKCKPT